MALSVSQLSGQFLNVKPNVGNDLVYTSSILNEDELLAHQQAFSDSNAEVIDTGSIYHDWIRHSGGSSYWANRDWTQGDVTVTHGDPTAGYTVFHNSLGNRVELRFSHNPNAYNGHDFQLSILQDGTWQHSNHDLFLDVDSGEGAYLSNTVDPSFRVFNPFLGQTVSVINGAESNQVFLIDELGSTTANLEAEKGVRLASTNSSFEYEQGLYKTFYDIQQEQIVVQAFLDENGDGLFHGGYQLFRGNETQTIQLGDNSDFSVENTTAQFSDYQILVADPYDHLGSGKFQSEALGVFFDSNGLSVGGKDNLSYTFTEGELFTQVDGFQLEIDTIFKTVNLTQGGSSVFESNGNQVEFVDPTALSAFHDTIQFGLGKPKVELSVLQQSGQFLNVKTNVGDDFVYSSSILNQAELLAQAEAFTRSNAEVVNTNSIYNDTVSHTGGTSYWANRDWNNQGLTANHGDPTAGFTVFNNLFGNRVELRFTSNSNAYNGRDFQLSILQDGTWQHSNHDLFLDVDSGEGAYISNTVDPSFRVFDPFLEQTVSVINGVDENEVLLIDELGNTTANLNAEKGVRVSFTDTQFQYEGNSYGTYYYLSEEQILLNSQLDHNGDGFVNGGYQIRRGFEQKDIFLGSGSVFSQEFHTTNTTEQFSGYQIFVSDPYDDLLGGKFQSEALGIVFDGSQLQVGGIEDISYTSTQGILSGQFEGYQLAIDTVLHSISLSQGSSSVFESIGDQVNFVDAAAFSEFHDVTKFNLAIPELV